MSMSLDLIFASIGGQESAELPANIEKVVADVVEDTAEEIAQEAAEAVVEAEIKEVEANVADLSKDVASTETTVEALEEKVEELQEHIDGMEAMAKGETPFNSQMFAYHFKKGSALAARFGAPVEHVGAESFADASTANLAAYQGMEGMKEVAQKAGGAIKKFFIQLFGQFISLYNSIFDRLKGFEKKAGVVKASVTTAASAGKLRKGKIPLAGAPASLLDAKGSAGGAIPAIINAVNTIGGTDGGAEGVQRLVTALTKMGPKVGTPKNFPGSDAHAVQVGATTVILVAPKDDENIGKATWSQTGDSAKNMTMVDALDGGALQAICDSVGNNAGKLQSAKLSAANLTKSRDQAIASAEASDKPVNRGAHAATLKMGEKALRFGGDILGAQLQFVQAHIANRLDKKDDKKDDKSEEKKEEKKEEAKAE